MELINTTTIITFVLLGLSENPRIQVILFQMFLLSYMSTVLGNVLLIVAVRIDSRLHTSMYFFLSSLSFLDICYTSIIVPKMLVNIATSSQSISIPGCFTQVFFYLFMGETECLLLAFMAYDRYVAICSPLRYNIIMNTTSCVRMISVAWVTGCIISSFDIYFTYQVKFCGPIRIDHFFCEGLTLLELSCGDLSANNILMMVGSSILLVIPVCLILYSYFKIVLVLIKIGSRRYKAFSTCVSHLIVVVIFYGTATFMYMKPRYSSTDVSDKMVSVFYTVVTPMLNPLIYSLRNKDVRRALRRIRKCITVP